jgi:hypothetical protein
MQSFSILKQVVYIVIIQVKQGNSTQRTLSQFLLIILHYLGEKSKTVRRTECLERLGETTECG